MYLKTVFFLAITCFLAGPASAQTTAEGEEGTDFRPFAERIFNRMRLSDTETSARLVDATVDYLTVLERILNERQATLDGVEAAAEEGDESAVAMVVAAYERAKDAYLPLKRDYVDQLEEGLPPYHVERVKDGLTHDALPNLHDMYLEMVPALTPGEKAHIFGLLVEARENAMLAISEEGQTQWLDKYRGIINNFIAAQGYDFGKLSDAWDSANPDHWAHGR